jgi:hypothetical protein
MVMNRLIVASAGVVFVAVLGCVLLGAERAAPAGGQNGQAMASPARVASNEGLPFVGAGMQIQRVDWIDRYMESIDEIAALGGDTVLLVVDARQENGTSSRIYLDMRMTPTPDQLGALIRHAKSRKLRVILMPIVLLDAPRGNEWRGTLKPASWEDWFDSYRDMLTHFAWVAEGNEADVLVIGSELVSSESQKDQWRKTIDHVRGIFKGRLTYSANWDHYASIPFWDQLDLVGMNSYYKLGKNNQVTVPEIQKRWSEIQKDLLAFQERVGKPLLFLEVGWCSLANAAHEPWDYTKVDEAIDLDLQKRLYEGFFTSWWGNAKLGGFMVWEWTPGEGGPDHRGYTPEGKPAEAVVREWFGQPRWEVP